MRASTETLLELSQVHPDWLTILEQALAAVDETYLESLVNETGWLPGIDRLLAAFRRDRDGLRYLLIGESPYPRRDSANGIAFYDAAVGDLWSPTGLSKAVNRATSLRNIVKTALLAEGLVERDRDGRITQQAIASLDKSRLIQTLPELFDNLERAGLLMLNATPVLHPGRKPAHEARYWLRFLDRLLALIEQRGPKPVTLLLWGKIANLIDTLPASTGYQKITCEHPYNMSFIDNSDMHHFFGNLEILSKARANPRRRDDSIF